MYSVSSIVVGRASRPVICAAAGRRARASTGAWVRAPAGSSRDAFKIKGGGRDYLFMPGRPRAQRLRMADPGAESSAGGGESSGKSSKKSSKSNKKKKDKDKKGKKGDEDPAAVSDDDLDAEDGEGDEDDASDAEADAKFKLSRGTVVVGFMMFILSMIIAALVHLPFRAAALKACKVTFSVLKLLTQGGLNQARSNADTVDGILSIFTLIVLRFALQPVTKRLYYWWANTRSEKQYEASPLHWLLLNVYGPVELALVTVAGMRLLEAGIERIGIIPTALLNTVVEKLVVVALVATLSRVTLSWQNRFFDQQAFELELEGKTLQADRLAGVSKLSSIATYLVTIVLGLKALGVNVGALVTFGGISGLAIGLAGRQILENAFMGLMLYATAPFMPGDEIVFSTREEKNIQGHVIDIGLFRTSIRSFQRELYYVPNSLFSSLVVLNITRKGKQWRIKQDILIRHTDAARVAVALSAYRSLLKSDGRVVQRLHRRVFLSEVTPEGLMCRVSFYVEAKNKDQFSGINQDFLSAFLETCRKNDVRLAVPMRGVMQMTGKDDEIMAELERYREKERKEIEDREMIELNDEGLTDEEENLRRKEKKEKQKSKLTEALEEISATASEKSEKKSKKKEEDASAPR